MEQWVTNYLYNDLMEAHGAFQNIISEMQENGVEYPYDSVIPMEESSYTKTYNAISRMDEIRGRYNYLMTENDDFFAGEFKLIAKHVMLYIISIIIIRIFAKTLSSEKLNEIWYGILGLALGSANVGVINKSINDYRYGNKEHRVLMDNLHTLKDDYEANFDLARKEVEYMFSLNRNLEKEIDKFVLKKIKMQ